MNLIKPSFEIVEQPSGIDGLYKHIELCGRTCYKSQDRITEDSAKKFVDGLIKSGHGSVLEHGTVYLKVYSISKENWNKIIGHHKLWTVDERRDYLMTNPTYDKNGKENWWSKDATHIASEMLVKYADNPYSKVNIVLKGHEINTNEGTIITPTGGYPRVSKAPKSIMSVFNTVLITTNLRVLLEKDWLDDLKYLCEPTEYHEKRYTVKFNCDIGISREFNRHRVNSMSEQSTRYCNYSKDKFDNAITYIIPNDCPSLIEGSKQEYSPFEITDTEVELMNAYQDAQKHYMRLIELGWKPQQARRVLPLGTATELIHTAFISDWEHFFKLRDHSAAHPQAIELAKPLHEEFIKRNYI
jgi:thymidylate synthase (FAD)